MSALTSEIKTFAFILNLISELIEMQTKTDEKLSR